MDEYPAGADHPATSQDRLINKLFVIKRHRAAARQIQGDSWRWKMVWSVVRNTEAGWPWPSVSFFDTWEAALEHIDNEIDEYTIPELKAHGYSIRRDWGASATSRFGPRSYYVCKTDSRVRGKDRNMVLRRGERAAWRAAWKHYKGEL